MTSSDPWCPTHSDGWITLVVDSGCVPPFDTTKWPGLSIRHPWHEMLGFWRIGEVPTWDSLVLIPTVRRIWHSSILSPSRTEVPPPRDIQGPFCWSHMSSLWKWIWRDCHQNGFILGPEESLATCLWTGQSPVTALASYKWLQPFKISDTNSWKGKNTKNHSLEPNPISQLDSIISSTKGVWLKHCDLINKTTVWFWDNDVNLLFMFREWLLLEWTSCMEVGVGGGGAEIRPPAAHYEAITPRHKV